MGRPSPIDKRFSRLRGNFDPTIYPNGRRSGHIWEGVGVEYSQIRAWSEAKLEIVRKYTKAYTTILRNQLGFSHLYIDAFAGAGAHISRTTDEFVAGSPLQALNIDPPFDEYQFIDIDPRKVGSLRELVTAEPNV
jgi:hypothetical protein